MQINPEFSKIISKLAKNHPELTDEQLSEMASWYFSVGQILVRMYISSHRKDYKNVDIQDNE